MVEYILSAIALHRETGTFGNYETFLEVSLTLNLIFFAFRGPVERFVENQAKLTGGVVEAACSLATRLSRRPEELEGRLAESRRRLRRVASAIFICRLCLPVVAITTLWLLAAYDGDDPVGQLEYWLVLSMSVPVVCGAVALYLSFFTVAVWHSFVALILAVYFAKPKVEKGKKEVSDLIASAPDIVGDFEASRTPAAPDEAME